MSRISKLLENKELPGYKNVFVRENGSSTFESPAKKYDLSPRDVIGWFATKNNMGLGYIIFNPSNHDKSEFGKDVYRIYNIGKDITSVVKFNLKKGQVYFIDNKEYEDNLKVKFLSPMVFDRLFIDQGKESYFK